MTELDRHDIQGLVLRGYPMPLATYLFYRFDTAAGARRWLASMIDPITTPPSGRRHRPGARTWP